MPRGSIDEQTELIKIYDLLDAYLDGFGTSLAALIANLANIAAMKAIVDRVESVADFWSTTQEEVALTATPGDVTMPSVPVTALPSGASIVKAFAIFKFRAVENTNAAGNKLSGGQYIQCKNPFGAYTNAITFVDDQFGLAAATREGGDVYIGNIDVKALFTSVGNYAFIWHNGAADQNNLQFNDVQMGFRIWFR